MRQLLACVTLLALALASGHAQDQPQRFRSKIDLLTVDVAAVDAKGRPVEDLRPGDFVVKVDGKLRSGFVRRADQSRSRRAGKPSRPTDALISTNAAPENARRIVLAVDQTLITPGCSRLCSEPPRSSSIGLTPSDYAAFIGFPEPGPRVDFTTDKAAVRKAMQTISIGQAAKVLTNDFDISLYEAFTMTGNERTQDRTSDGRTPPGPVMQRVLERANEAGLCTFGLQQCQRDIYNTSLTMASEARLEGTISLKALEAMLKDLVPIEGPKSMVIFSAGMVSEDPTALEQVKRLAAAARTTINVIAVDRDRGELISQTNMRASSSLFDRSFELEGLERIADVTNGTLFRGIAAGAGIFERIESELSAWYLVAVERQPGDPESQTHRG